MLVFIDESGDAGFKLAKGSSPYFCAAMVIFRSVEASAATSAIIREALTAAKVRPEFKFSKCSHKNRDAFFDATAKCDFGVRAIVVEKERIYSPHLRSEKEGFYRFFVKNLMKFDNGALDGARVIIDGSGERTFRKDLRAHLRKHTADGAIKDVRLKDSIGDPLVQLADMSVGAIARSYQPEKKHYDRWMRALKPKIEDVWDFK